jgi:lambda repressor-like predicted transcriptional regulator
MSAGAENQISVDLKLQLDSLGADAAKAGKIISSGLASSVKGLGETTYEREDRMAEEQKQRQKRERAIRNRKLDEADAAKDAKEAAKKAAIATAAQERQTKASKVSRGQILRAGVAGLAGVGLGVPGLGSIAALAQINPVAAAVTASLKILGAAIQMTARSAEEAKRYYSKTLQSGFGTQLTIKRSLLANAIGVGENEVWQYGAAVSALNEKFSHATKVLSEANPVLTQLSWETSVMKADFDALKAKIAVDLVPAMESFIEWVDKLAKHLTDWATPPEDANPQILESQARKAFGEQEGITPALIEGEKPSFINRALGLSSEPEADATKGFVDKKGADVTDKYKDKFEAFLKNFKPGAPSPVAYMKQLPASQWEHMGLIIGGSGTNYAKDTSKNTARMTMQLEAIKLAIKLSSNATGFPLPSLP